MFEYQDRSLAIDPSSALWVGSGGDWKCVSPSCTVSGALRVVDYLIG